MQNEEYSSMIGISQSMIKYFKSNGPLKYKKKYIDKTEKEEESDSFIFGSLVDTLLFTPEVFLDRFYISDSSKKPSEEVCNIVETVFKNAGDLDSMPTPITLDMLEDELLEAAKNWNGRWKDEAKAANLIKNGSAYFEFLKLAKGKEIITTSDNFQAVVIKENCLSHPIASKYFVSCPGVDVLFQVEISCQINGIYVKGAFDILRVDHEAKTVQLVDFKTTQDVQTFIGSIHKYGYGLQLSFYKDLLGWWLLEKNLSDYKILPCLNIAVDRKEKMPYIFEYSDKDLELEKYGHGSKKGWLHYLTEINWHQTKNIWTNKEYYQHGKILVNLYEKEREQL